MLALLCLGIGQAWAQGENAAPPEKPLLESKTVTEAELDLPNRPFVIDGVSRGNMAQYFNGRTAGTRSFVVGQFQLAPGSEPHPVHAHPDDELLIVTAGEGEVDCAGRTTRVTAGSVMYAAPNVAHGIRNTGSTPLTFYFVKWIETATEPEANTLTPAEARAGWRLLWDGRTTAGWRGAQEPAFPAATWRMEQGILTVDPVEPGTAWRGADIVTRERFSDFELSVDFAVSSGANSGIKYFVEADAGQGSASSLGLEYQLIDDERHPDAKQGREGNRKLAAAYDLYSPATAGLARPAGEWNTARIVARGGRVEHWLNGVKVLAYDRSGDSFRSDVARSKYRALAGFGQARDGHILLQDHGDRVQFRNLKIRPAPVAGTAAGGHVISVAGREIRFDGKPVKLLGLRASNALMTDATTQELIDHLEVFQSYGVNTISVYVMGSRFGDVKGYRPDATLDPLYAARLARILAAADRRGMIVLVGCLYWSESEAKAELGHWTQREANLAVANTVRWLAENGFNHVIIDPDNEGMANKDPQKGWSIAEMIDAGHRANPFAVMAYNARPTPPANADLTIHHAPRVPGKPYVETEGTPQVVPYWHEYSRREGYKNYLNVGLYTEAMKAEQRRDTDAGMAHDNGFMIASTWLQAAPPLGPNQRPGGDGLADEPGIRWWLEYIKAHHAPLPRKQ